MFAELRKSVTGCVRWTPVYYVVVPWFYNTISTKHLHSYCWGADI